MRIPAGTTGGDARLFRALHTIKQERPSPPGMGASLNIEKGISIRMINEFIEYLDAQVGRSLYVWGAQGQTDITEAWIRSRETSEANVQRVLALWKKLQAEDISPIAAYDCSGLIMHYLQDITGFYKTDLSAAGLYSKCTPVTRNALKKGDLVFRHNGTKIHHVGVYAGDGTAIESQGRDVGVTRRALDASGTGYWNRYGRLPLPDAPEPEKPEPAKTYFATVGGGSVYVRSGRSSTSSALGVAYAGDRMLALPAESGWCEIAVALDGKLAKGYMGESYVKREG